MPTVSFYLRDGADDDIADRLRAEPTQCEAIRQALRAWYGRGDDIAERLERIEALLAGGRGPIATTGNFSAGDAIDASAIDTLMRGW